MNGLTRLGEYWHLFNAEDERPIYSDYDKLPIMAEHLQDASQFKIHRTHKVTRIYIAGGGSGKEVGENGYYIFRSWWYATPAGVPVPLNRKED